MTAPTLNKILEMPPYVVMEIPGSEVRVVQRLSKGELNRDHAKTLKELLGTLKGKDYIIDYSNATYVSTKILQTSLTAAKENKRKPKVVLPSDSQVRNLMELSGVISGVEPYETLEDALKTDS